MRIEVKVIAIIKSTQPLGNLSLLSHGVRSLWLGPITPPEKPGGDDVVQNGGMTYEGADETAGPMGGDEVVGPDESEIFYN